MAVPYTFGSATSAIPLSQLDSNFNTTITLGNTAIQLGNTVTTLNNMTFANVTISSVSTPITVAQGGTGTSTAFTAGSVVFAGASGVYSQNNANFFWDNTNARLGIGTSSPGAKLEIGSLGVFRMQTGSTVFNVTPTAGANDYLVWNTSNALSGFAWNINSTERMRIDSSGNLLVGATSATSRLLIVGSGATSATNNAIFLNSSSTNLFTIRDDGYTYAPYWYNTTTASAANVFVDTSGGLLRSTSSLKYKTNVQDAKFGLADVLKLRAVTYQGKNDGNTVFGGLIAEEVHEAGLTEFVQYAKDGSPDALHYGHMVSLCIKAIQELHAKVQALESQLAAKG